MKKTICCIFFAVLIISGCQNKADTSLDCQKIYQVESGEVITNPGIYHIQGWTGFSLNVCVDAEGYLEYSFYAANEPWLKVDGKSRAVASGPELAASRIKASKKWGMLWTEEALWVYSVDGGGFSWRSGNGPGRKYICMTESTSASANDNIRDGMNTVYTAVMEGQKKSWAARKGQFRPYNDGYPQIIQAFDYGTIVAIEAVYDILQKAGNDEKAFVTLGPNSIRFGKNSGSAFSVEVKDGKTLIGGKVFSDKNSVVLFSALSKVLNTVSKDSPCREVRFAQYKTRVYEKRTIIEFGCPPDVVQVDCFSNGPGNDERLYVLDIMKAEESMNWMN